MAEFKTIPLDDIIIPDRLRAVEEDHALAIQASIVEHGLINPITVRRTPPATKPFRPYTLVAGAHRLRAVELLDEDGIEAMIVEADKAEAQLVEITENLFRNELSVLDRAMFVMSYREVWEERHGKVQPGRPGNSVNITELISSEAASGFSVHVASRLGLSVSSIEKAQFLAKRLSPELRQRLRGTPTADHRGELFTLAKLDTPRQKLVAVALDQGHDIAAALEHTDPHAKAKVTRTDGEKRRDTVRSNFHALGDRDRKAMLQELISAYPKEAAWAIANPLPAKDGGGVMTDPRQVSIFDLIEAGR